MDSTSEGAAVNLFKIGPTTMIGRVIALQVLSCKQFKDVLLIVLAKVMRNFKRTWSWVRSWVRNFTWLVSPRNPEVVVAVMVITTICLGRMKMRTLENRELNLRRKYWTKYMKSVLTYREWAYGSGQLEKGRVRKVEKDLYDEDLLQSKLAELRSRREQGNVEELLFCLRADLVRNLGNMCNPELHKGRFQAPDLINDYITEVTEQLHYVCRPDSEGFSLEERTAFMQETRHAFGRTALLLSGGAALGAFHLGVVKTLIDHRLLPRVLAGASVGSITCSFAATRTWSELESFFDDPMPPMGFFGSMGSIIKTAHKLYTKGAVHDIGELQRKMRHLIGDLTFQEAFDLSGRVLGISICSLRKHEPPRCLNYLTSPHVVIWSAVTASCAFPGLFKAQELMAKDSQNRLVPYHGATIGHAVPEGINKMKRQWRDGSLESDLPMLELKELFNVNNFIVSQANPHIAPFLRLKEFTRVVGGDFAAKLAEIAEMEVKHRCNQMLRMGFPMKGLAKLFAQDWEGDVTIVMPATLAQFVRIIQNPTQSELRKATMQGCLGTWEKLSNIWANCGIELVLDECVLFLRDLKKLQREAQRQNGRLVRSTTTRRIPSWNCLTREGSSGSLDEDGIMEQNDGVGIMEQKDGGGPWGGRSVRRLRPLGHNCDGSDSDSGTENMDGSNFSWTKAGGPLMRSPSALKFMLGHENDGDAIEHISTTAIPNDSGYEGDWGRTYYGSPTKMTRSHSQDQCCSKTENKIWETTGWSPRSSDNSKRDDNDSLEEQNFSFSGQSESKISVSAVLKGSNNSFGEGEISLLKRSYSAQAVSECSDMGKGIGNEQFGCEYVMNRVMAKDLKQCSLKSLLVDLPSRTGMQNPEDLAVTEISVREMSRATAQGPLFDTKREGTTLSWGAFGSFITKVSESPRAESTVEDDSRPKP